jgi:hypothetical protein
MNVCPQQGRRKERKDEREEKHRAHREIKEINYNEVTRNKRKKILN